MAYFTPRAYRASYISGLAKAASALWTLPRLSFAAQAVAFPIEQQQRVVAGGLEVAVVGAVLLLAVGRRDPGLKGL